MLKLATAIITKQKGLSSEMENLVAPPQEGQETPQGKQCCLCDRSGGYLKWFVRVEEHE